MSMSGLNKIELPRDLPRLGNAKLVTRQAEQWLDDQGYDLGKPSVDQELVIWKQLYDELQSRGVDMRELPGHGRLLMTHRVDRLIQQAFKRWRQRSCESMSYPFVEYVRDGMICRQSLENILRTLLIV